MRMPLFLLPCAGLIIPERVQAPGVGRRSQGVGQPERHEFAEFHPRLGQEQRVVDPLFRMGRVARLRNDVEIAGQDQRLFVLHELARMGDEPLHEHELVWVFLRTGRIAVRQIDARHPHDAVAGRDDRFEVTGLGVVLVPRQSARDLERPFGENGDAVERLLAVGLDVIAEFLDLHARKLVVEALDLLQTERIGTDLLQIVEEVGKPLAD